MKITKSWQNKSQQVLQVMARAMEIRMEMETLVKDQTTLN
jgi:hypothetical protein